jgi:methionine-gamma-lyase
MGQVTRKHQMGTVAIHAGRKPNPEHAHATPIYETSTFSFPDVATGQAIWRGDQDGHIYTRLSNPNFDEVTSRIAALEGIDLYHMSETAEMDSLARGYLFASGMAAITTALLTVLKGGDTIIAQESLYGATFTFLKNVAPQYGIEVVWLRDPQPDDWEKAFMEHPAAKLAYAETPSNPSMAIVQLQPAAEIAHQYGAWLMVDNTFATPYCQRPLTLGADVVLHSTTKYLGGHGLVVGGAVVSRHVDWVKNELAKMAIHLGGNPSPFDAWMVGNGIRTLDVRMQRHCFNAIKVAHFLADNPAVGKVFYPGLSSHPDYEHARKQMHHFGAMIAFELNGGYDAGVRMMDRVRLATLAVSLGTVDTLIQHPASMTHSKVNREDRLHQGITDGLVRLSVGIEYAGDIIDDLDQALIS